MRNLKKILSVLLVVAIMAISMVPAFAATSYTYEAQAKALYDAGLFKGVSATEYAPDLGSALTREQGFALVVRLLGKADAAAALSAADVDAALAAYGDAKDIEPSLKNAVAYAVKNNLVQGDGKLVNPKGAMLGKDLATVILRNLGYKVDAAGYDTAAATLADKGGLTAAEVTKFASKELIRDDLVGMVYGSLKAKYSTGKTVIEQLVADKAVTADGAAKLGYTVPTAATSLTAAATGAKKFTLTFNGPVDDTKVNASAVTVKKGSTALTVSDYKLAADKKSAVVTIANAITAGEYTVSVTGIATDVAVTAKVTAENERIDKITFPSESAVLKSATDFTKINVIFKILNQYGEDVTTRKYTSFTFYGSKGEQTIKDGVLEYSVAGQANANYVIGEKISVSATYVDTDTNKTVFNSAVLTVAQMAQVSDVKITKLYNPDNATLTKNKDFSNFYLVVEAKDQYGSAIKADALQTAVVVQATDPSIATFDSKTVSSVVTPLFKEISINGEKVTVLALANPASNVTARAGKSTIMIVSKFSGSMAQYDVEVKDVQKIDTLQLSAPEVAVAGDVIKIPFTAIDKDGNEITTLDGLKMNNDVNTLTVSGGTTSTTAKFEYDAVSGKPVLNLNTKGLTTKATLFISGVTATYKYVNLSVSLKDKATLDTVIGVKSDYKTNVLLNNKVKFTYDKVLVQDNYTRDVVSDNLARDFDFGAKYQYKVETSDPTVIALSGTTVTDATYGYFTGASMPDMYFTAIKKGSSTVTVSLEKLDGTTWKNVSDTRFNVSAVEAKDIQSFKVAAIDKVFTTKAYNATTYESEVKVTGVLSNGKEVEIPKTLSDGTRVYNVSTSSDISYDLSNGKISSALSTPLDTDKTKDTSVIVSVYNINKPATLTLNTKILGELPTATKWSVQSTADGRKAAVANDTSYVKEADNKVSINKLAGKTDTIANMTAFAKLVVKITDQYGITVPAASNYIKDVQINNIKGSNFTGDNYKTQSEVETNGFASGDSFDVTIVTIDGKSFTYTVSIN